MKRQNEVITGQPAATDYPAVVKTREALTIPIVQQNRLGLIYQFILSPAWGNSTRPEWNSANRAKQSK